VEEILERHRIVRARREFRQELIQSSELVEEIENFVRGGRK
jgi:hypothetical protein